MLQFPYRDRVVNLLDTPGHRDFSEDTYRVLSAVDAVIMVLDAAKGIESQTLKLFQVCHARNLPVLTFLNKWDRPGLEPLELLDAIEHQIGLRPTPVTWPVGVGESFAGVVDRRDGRFWRFVRTSRGATVGAEELLDAEQAAAVTGGWWAQAQEELGLLDAIGADLDLGSFRAGSSTPVFVGSALTNFGVKALLDAVVDLAPAPSAQEDGKGEPRALDAGFSAFVFKIQANMDPAHRDRVAFARVCSGAFERGMVATNGRTGKPFATKYATSVFGSERATVDEAVPGDVIGLVNANGLQLGDTLYTGDPVQFPGLPRFAPEVFATARPRDTGRFKQFRRGLEQLDEEGVVQVLRDPDLGDTAPVLAAVGQLQLEVFAHRIEAEFGAPTELTGSPYVAIRLTDARSAEVLRTMSGVRVLNRGDGAVVALFESVYRLQRLEAEDNGLSLVPILADATTL